METMEMTGVVMENLSGTLSTGDVLAFMTAGIALGGSLMLILIVRGIIQLLTIIAGWKMLNKANLPGWGILIPVYNIYLLFKLAGRPGGWTRWILFPPVLIILLIIVNFDIAKRFGKGVGFGLGLLFLHPIFIMILGFGNAKYHPVGEKSEVIEA